MRNNKSVIEKLEKNNILYIRKNKRLYYCFNDRIECFNLKSNNTNTFIIREHQIKIFSDDFKKISCLIYNINYEK